MSIETVAVAMTSAAIYSLVFYAKKSQKTGGEPFDWYKLASTIIIGAGIGMASVYRGDTLSQADLEAQLTMYGGIALIVESAIKAAYRAVSKSKSVNEV